MAENLASTARDLLEGDRDHLRAQLDELEAGHEESLAFDDNFADSGQVAAELGENKALASKLRDQLADVERALAKIEAGTYGQCETCGDSIGDARMEAIPMARYCISHA